MDGDDNSADQMDDNLLEPLSEVSFCEREKTFTATVKNAPPQSGTGVSAGTGGPGKDPDATLPDARAKVLHLQRVQRGGASGSGSSSGSEMAARNSGSKSRNAKGSDKDGNEKEEETVSLSLDSLIRCEVKSDKVRAANFKSNFKFGKPDDDISLRCNPSANYFYDHSNEPYSDDTSDTYDSSGEREGPADESRYAANIQNGNGLEHVAVPATDEATPAAVVAAAAASSDVDSAADVSAVTGAAAVSGNLVKAKGKRGRPPLTEEERNERAARKEAIRMQNQSMLKSESMSTEAEDFSLGMGHSIFHSDAPKKKRGRPPKARYPQFLNSTTQSDQDAQNTSSQLNDSLMTAEHEFPIKKKRGRKPKSYYLEIAAAAEAEAEADEASDAEADAQTDESSANNNSSIQNGTASAEHTNQTMSSMNDTLPSSARMQQIATIASGPKKRGRKPKYLENYYIKLEQQQIMPPSVEVPRVLKKRGRKPKNFYLQQMNDDRANESAPAILEANTSSDTNVNRLQQSHASGAAGAQTSFDFDAYANKRGRRPKAYYEHLATLVKQEGGSPSTPAHRAAYQHHQQQQQNKHISSSAELSQLSMLSDEPPAKKKRGRKPKSYYWNLELQQQEAEHQDESAALRGDNLSSQSRLAPATATTTITPTAQSVTMAAAASINPYRGQTNPTAHSSNFLPTRPLIKPTIVRPYTAYRPYGHVRRIMSRPVRLSNTLWPVAIPLE